MSYSVQWTRRALDALARIRLDNPAHRAIINQAVANVDEILQIDPGIQGESRDDDRRILFAAPLIVVFRVNRIRRVVRVSDIGFIRHRGSH